MPELTATEYGDAMMSELKGLGATSGEIVGALNELAGTSGLEYLAAKAAYIASSSGFYDADYTADYGSD